MLLPEEQKGCGQKCKGTGDPLFIDKMILQDMWMRKKNLAVMLFSLMILAWNLAYINVLHQFCRGGKLQFGEILLPDGRVMKGLIEGAGYKYLGILQADQIQYMEMKEKVKTKYLRRVSKVLETKLNGGNIFKWISTWAVSLLRYSVAFIGWNCAELTQLDRRTRKLMTMHNTLHPKSNIDRLYIPRKEGVRGLQGAEESVNLTNLGLENYVKESREHLLALA